MGIKAEWFVLLVCAAICLVFIFVFMIFSLFRPKVYKPSNDDMAKMMEAQKRAVAIADEKQAQERAKAAEEELARQKAEHEKFLKTKAGRIWQKHQDWPKEICETVAQGKVRIGMNADQIRAAWGNPDRIHTTKGVAGGMPWVHQQWVYDRGRVNQYLYLEDGVLTTYSD